MNTLNNIRRSRHAPGQRHMMVAFLAGLALVSSVCAAAWPVDVATITDSSGPHLCPEHRVEGAGEAAEKSCDQADELTPLRSDDLKKVPAWISDAPHRGFTRAGMRLAHAETLHTPAPPKPRLRPHLLNAQFNE